MFEFMFKKLLEFFHWSASYPWLCRSLYRKEKQSKAVTVSVLLTHTDTNAFTLDFVQSQVFQTDAKGYLPHGSKWHMNQLQKVNRKSYWLQQTKYCGTNFCLRVIYLIQCCLLVMCRVYCFNQTILCITLLLGPPFGFWEDRTLFLSSFWDSIGCG